MAPRISLCKLKHTPTFLTSSALLFFFTVFRINWLLSVCVILNFHLLILLFMSGCAGSSLLPRPFWSRGDRGLFSKCSAWASHYAGFSYRAQALGWGTFRSCGSPAPKPRLDSCSMACGIFPDQGSNPCLLDGQVNSSPLSHQKSPYMCAF